MKNAIPRSPQAGTHSRSDEERDGRAALDSADHHLPWPAYASVPIATMAAFVLSSVYYAVLSGLWHEFDPTSMAGAQPSAARILAEVLRTLAVTYVLSRVLRLLGAKDLKSALALALWLWFGFSFLMWTGAILWENTPWQVAAIHSGDWLFKTLLIVAILSGRRRQIAPATQRL